MASADGFTSAEDDYVLADEGETYAIYLPEGGTTRLHLEDRSYRVRWFNPWTDGGLQGGSVANLTGSGPGSLGAPHRVG